MSQDVSGFGLVIQLVASSTFPAGVTLSQFADDADPFDLPSVNIGDSAMGLNGDLVKWSKANPIKITINVIPGTEDDQNLAVLFDANRVGRGRSSAQDNITVTGIYPDGQAITLTNGLITDGMPGSGVASAGRLKSKPYQFTFEGLSRV
jgi:hypothetical protein